MGRGKLIFFLIFVTYFSGFAGLDSLKIKLQKAKNDSARIELYYKAVASSKYNLKTTDSILDILRTYRTNSNCSLRFSGIYRIGCYYSDKEIHSKALEYLLMSLKTADSCKNINALMRVRNRLALVNKLVKNFKVSIFNAHVSLGYARELKDSFILASNYTLLGNMYKTDMLLDSALNYHFKALAIREVSGDPIPLAACYSNLGLVYKNKRDFKKALEYLRKSLSLRKGTKDKAISASYNNLSIVFRLMGSFDSCIFYSQKALNEGLKRKNGNVLAEAMMALASVYDTSGDFRTAAYYYKRLKVVEDSINKEKISTDFQELQSKYESDKKDADLALQSESLKTAAALNSRKNILITLSTIALLMALIAAVFIFRSYRQSKRNAEALEAKNKIIEEKNKEITDSINYAKNIQESLITNEKVFVDNLKDHFILYLPKDIVAGDFYWAQKVGNEFLIICADCTGHGVPGAFMSLMGMAYLKDIIIQKNIARPDLILNDLRDQIIEGFGPNGNKDGMDASLVKLNGKELQVAAANNSIWILRNEESIVVKPDKFPIGQYSGQKQPFTLNTIALQENDIVLMYTDGYGDQFGGPNNKKFKHSAMEKLLTRNQHLPMNEMKDLLFETLKEWQGNNEQIDDILVIGFRV
jgi:serine phosphatase RsbU (regulator of sigma subunit)